MYELVKTIMDNSKIVDKPLHSELYHCVEYSSSTLLQVTKQTGTMNDQQEKRKTGTVLHPSGTKSETKYTPAQWIQQPKNQKQEEDESSRLLSNSRDEAEMSTQVHDPAVNDDPVLATDDEATATEETIPSTPHDAASSAMSSMHFISPEQFEEPGPEEEASSSPNIIPTPSFEKRHAECFPPFQVEDATSIHEMDIVQDTEWIETGFSPGVRSAIDDSSPFGDSPPPPTMPNTYGIAEDDDRPRWDFQMGDNDIYTDTDPYKSNDNFTLDPPSQSASFDMEESHSPTRTKLESYERACDDPILPPVTTAVVKESKQDTFRRMRTNNSDGNSLESFGDEDEGDLGDAAMLDPKNLAWSGRFPTEARDFFCAQEESDDSLVGMVVGEGCSRECPIASDPSKVLPKSRRGDTTLSQLELDMLSKRVIKASNEGSQDIENPILPTGADRSTSVLSQLERDMLEKHSSRPDIFADDHENESLERNASNHRRAEFSGSGRSLRREEEDYLAKQQVIAHMEQRAAAVVPPLPSERQSPTIVEPTPTNEEDDLRRALPEPTVEEVPIQPLLSNTSLDDFRIDPPSITAVDSPTFSEHGNILKGPSYFDEEDGADGLVVARMVEEDEDWDRPSAFMVEPSSKGPFKSVRVFNRIVLLVVLSLLITTVAVILGTKKNLSPLQYRESIGLKESLARTVGLKLLDDRGSPEFLALQWITHEDPLQLTTASPGLTQRFLLSAFYLTTADRATGYGLGCDPSLDVDDTTCSLDYRYLRDSPTMSREVLAHRWLSGAPECDWAGVECDDLGQVRKLQLRWASFKTTEIPKSLDALPFLTALDVVGARKLEGEVSQWLFETKHMVQLELPHNSLASGTNFSEVFGMRSLKYLDLGDNQMSGNLDSRIGQAKNMKSLKLSNNQFYGTLPPEVGDIHLSQLFLSNNEITGQLPDSLGSAEQSLEILLLDGNQLTGTIPEFNDAPFIDWIHLGNNFLEGTIPKSLFSFSTMATLNLQGNALTGPVSRDISKLENLFFLDLSSNQLTGDVPSELGSLYGLLELDLHDNRFEGEIPEEVCQKTEPSNAFVLDYLVADCRPDDGGDAEISCSCCSICCDRNGEQCFTQT